MRERCVGNWRRVVDLPAGRQVRDPYGKAGATRGGPAPRTIQSGVIAAALHMARHPDGAATRCGTTRRA